MRTLYWIILLIVVVLYLRYYYKFPKEVAILQTTLNSFTLDILREKQPVVIQDRVQDLNEIKNSWFKYVLPSSLMFESDQHSRWYTNKYKYLILHPTSQCEVLLYPSTEKMDDTGVPPQDATLIAIQLAENQMLIIPYRMHSSISCVSQVHALGVHDYVTKLLP